MRSSQPISGVRLRSAPAIAAALVAVLSSAGCGTSGITKSGLQQSVGTAYQRLYLLQQAKLGHLNPVTPDAAASCARSGTSALSGAGSWLCTVHFPFPDGHIEPLTFDVEVQPIGCYTAAGPPTVVGQQLLQTQAGRSVTNPLFAFDGCFDSS